MKMNVMELTGAALDWAVAKCEGLKFTICDNFVLVPGASGVKDGFNPSANWSQGGPIIERERICVMPADEDLGSYWGAGKRSTKLYTGETHLIAAMRYYVGCNLGDEVDVPDPLAMSEKV